MGWGGRVLHTGTSSSSVAERCTQQHHAQTRGDSSCMPQTHMIFLNVKRHSMQDEEEGYTCKTATDTGHGCICADKEAKF